MNKITGLSAKAPQKFAKGKFYVEESYPDSVWICALVGGYNGNSLYQLINLASGNCWSVQRALCSVGGEGTWTQVLTPFVVTPE